MSPSLDWKENVAPDEAAHFERLGEQLRELQRRHAEAGKPSRTLHAKALGGFLAELTVLPDLPEHARVGLFASPATYQAYARFSNGAGRRQADGKPDVRGVAIKVLGVPGKKLIPGMEDETTQDFLLDQPGFVIGRGKNPVGLKIKDPNGSRQHALIEQKDGVYYLVDLGSVNGVEVNGVRVTRKAIAEGDVARICEHLIRFTFQRG